MDVWGYYEHDQMVRWFLGRPLSKSELHRRAKRLGGKGGLPGVRQGAGGGAAKLEGYLPSSAIHGKLWAVDSFAVEVPFGKTTGRR